MSQSSDVVSAFSKIQKSMAGASPMRGVFFPSDGKHICILEDITFDGNSKTKVNKAEVPAMAISFRYRLVEDPESPSNPRAFMGKTFYLPLSDDAYAVAPGKKTSKPLMERDRFMGHLTTILGRDIADPTQMGSEFALVLDKLAKAKANNTTITLEVQCKTDTRTYKGDDGKDREFTDREELLTALLSA